MPVLRLIPADRPRRWGRLRTLAGLTLAATAVAGPGAPPAGAQAAPPPADACAGVETTVSLVGGTSAKEAFSRWGLAICQQAGVVADFTDLGSKAGRDAVTPADAAVIGLTALPFTAEEQAALQEEQRQVVMVPLVATSVTCTYWDTNPFEPALAGSRYPNLRISRRTLADLFGGSPRDGSNYSPDLAADNAGNPDFTVGPPFLVVEPWLRSGASAVTYQFTSWLAQDEQAGADFLKGSFAGATIPFEEAPVPLGTSPQLLNDYSTMISRMTGASQSLGIGCMDGATARSDSRPDTPEVETLNAAWLDNATGTMVAPTADSVSRAVDGMTPQADGTFTPDWALDDPAAYPLPLVVYAAAPTCGIDAATRNAMDEVLTYAIGPGQGNLPPGNVPLPTSVATTAASQLGKWRQLTATVGACGQVTPPTTDPGPPDTTPFGSDLGDLTGPGGVYTDPSLVPTGSAAPDGAVVDPGAAPATGPTSGPGDGDEGPLAPLRRIVAVATGSAALPPVLVLVLGVALVAGGPALQIAGGRRRVGSLPWTASRWFQRLRP